MDMREHEQPTTPWQSQQVDFGQQRTIEQNLPVTGATQTAKRPRGISRRKLIAGAAGASAVVAAGGIALEQWIQHSSSGSTFHGPLAANAQIGHLLRRAGFGATPDELTAYTALGYSGAVDRLINYQPVSDDATEKRLSALNLDFTKLQQQQQWWLLRMAWTQRPLLEKMTLFWHGFLTSSYHKVGGKNSYTRMIDQNKFLRSHAFDTFDNMLLGITSDPAMLVYLDLTKSKKNAPNENYARELMELFTLGIGHYAQQDVYEAAAALTGWHVAGSASSSEYHVNDHNTNTKTYLGQTGNFDYKDIVRILASHPATPWYIGRRLFAFFAYENPSDADVKPLVDAYVKSNHNMGEVMKALLLSPQFNSEKAYRARVKSPTEFVVGVYRALNITGAEATLPTYTIVIGQSLFDPPNVAGWPGDKVSSLWLNSGTWMARLNYVNYLLMDMRSGGKRGHKAIDYQSIVDANHIDSPARFVDYFSAFLLDGSIDADRKAHIVDYLTTPQTTKTAPQQVKFTNGKSYTLSNVRGAVYLIMASPEYQLN